MHHNYSLHCFAVLILVVPLWLTFSLLSKSCSASPCLRFLTIVLRKRRAPLFGSNYCLPHFFSACKHLSPHICTYTSLCVQVYCLYEGFQPQQLPQRKPQKCTHFSFSYFRNYLFSHLVFIIL